MSLRGHVATWQPQRRQRLARFRVSTEKSVFTFSTEKSVFRFRPQFCGGGTTNQRWNAIAVLHQSHDCDVVVVVVVVEVDDGDDVVVIEVVVVVVVVVAVVVVVVAVALGVEICCV